MATSPNLQADMAELFDFVEAAMPDAPQLAQNSITDTVVAPSEKTNACPSHAEEDGCLCHGFMGVEESDAANAAIGTSLNDWWTKDFSNYVPRYSKPDEACEYCRSRQLDCFYTFEGQKTCSPCNALFRTCSFEGGDTTESRHPRSVDTLQSLEEDVEIPFGGMTGIRLLKTNLLGRLERQPSQRDGDGKKNSARFSRAALKVLKEWMEDHRDNPYPTDEEKEALKDQTGLNLTQVSNWFANTRRREKTKSSRHRGVSPSIRPARTAPVSVPDGRRWDALNPMERWKISPPENEPAPINAIVEAVKEFSPSPEDGRSVSSKSRYHDSKSSGGASSLKKRAPSTTSLETGKSSAFSSGSMSSAAWSAGSASMNSLGSFGSFSSLGSEPAKERRRRRKIHKKPTRNLTADTSRLFQCTFCTDRFKSKYDWSRHEKSLHLSLEKWICAPLGTTITVSASGEKKCTYCDMLNPSKAHLDTHNHECCEEKGIAARTFYRKDHLRQHLRLVHNCKMIPSMDAWRSEANYIKSRCGFCATYFTKWQDRVDHLAKEFRSGRNMKDWTGCRGFDANIAALVTNAMPPYLIDHESRSPAPFSASNRVSMCQHPLSQEPTDPNGPSNPAKGVWDPTTSSTISPTADQPLLDGGQENRQQDTVGATCWEILTVRLGYFARQKRAEGVLITDSMLQREARSILYEDPDDTWNQTAADNPEWLTLFKKAHGIDGGDPTFNVTDALEDLGVLGNLNWDGPLDRRYPVTTTAGEVWNNISEIAFLNKTGQNPAAMTAVTTAGNTLDLTAGGAAPIDHRWDLGASKDGSMNVATSQALGMGDLNPLAWSGQNLLSNHALDMTLDQEMTGTADNFHSLTTTAMDLGDLDAPFPWDEPSLASFGLPSSGAQSSSSPTGTSLENTPPSFAPIDDKAWDILTGDWAKKLPECKPVGVRREEMAWDGNESYTQQLW